MQRNRGAKSRAPTLSVNYYFWHGSNVAGMKTSSIVGNRDRRVSAVESNGNVVYVWKRRFTTLFLHSGKDVGPERTIERQSRWRKNHRASFQLTESGSSSTSVPCSPSCKPLFWFPYVFFATSSTKYNDDCEQTRLLTSNFSHDFTVILISFLPSMRLIVTLFCDRWGDFGEIWRYNNLNQWFASFLVDSRI